MSESYSNELHFGWGLLAFFFPFVGIILALLWFNTHPGRARSCIVGILVVMILGVILYAILLGIGIYAVLNPNYSGTGTNWNNQGDYGSTQKPFVYPSEPNPNEAVYEASSDGVLRFYLANEDLPTVYDEATNSVIAWDKFSCSIYVYNATSGEQVFTKEYSQTLECVAAYGGKLAVALHKDATIDVVNLTTFASQKLYTGYFVYSMELMDDAIIFAGNDSLGNSTDCEIYRAPLSNGAVTTILTSVYQPTFAVNREKNILYVAERGLSSCDFYYVNLKTNYAENKTYFMQYAYSNYELFYDGTYVHAFGNLYDTVRGKIKYQGQSIVPSLADDSTPYSTLCINGRYSLTVTSDCKTVVYDSITRNVVHTLNLYATRIYSLGNNKYLALCGDSGYYALIDLNK